MEGIKDVKSDGSLSDKTEKGVVFIDLPLMITMLVDLSALKVRPAQFRAIIQRESKVLAPQIVEDMFRSSMKALMVVTRYYLNETAMWWLPRNILGLYSYQLKKGL